MPSFPVGALHPAVAVADPIGARCGPHAPLGTVELHADWSRHLVATEPDRHDLLMS